MSEKLVYLYNEGVSVTFIDEGKPVTIKKDHPRFDEIVSCLSSGDHDKIPNLVVSEAKVVSFMEGKVRIEGSEVFYGTLRIGNPVVDKIIQFIENGINANPLIKFLDNLMKNPNRGSVEQLYLFLEHGNMPITEDGHFLAYKYLSLDYKSLHVGKETVRVNGVNTMGHIDNSIGNIVEMDRDEVDSDPNSACSVGLHVGSYNYVSGNSTVVVVKVNPRDVVSVPTDYGNQKMRTCRYEVISDFREVMPEPYFSDEGCEDEVEDEDDDSEDFLDDESGASDWESDVVSQLKDDSNLVDDVLNILQNKGSGSKPGVGKPELRVEFRIVSMLDEVIAVVFGDGESCLSDYKPTKINAYSVKAAGLFGAEVSLIRSRSTAEFYAPKQVSTLLEKIKGLNPDKEVIVVKNYDK